MLNPHNEKVCSSPKASVQGLEVQWVSEEIRAPCGSSLSVLAFFLSSKEPSSLLLRLSIRKKGRRVTKRAAPRSLKERTCVLQRKVRTCVRVNDESVYGIVELVPTEVSLRIAEIRQ